MTPTARPRYGPGSGAVGLKTLSDRPRSPRRPACQEKCTSSCVSRAVRNGGAQDRCQTRRTSRARYSRVVTCWAYANSIHTQAFPTLSLVDQVARAQHCTDFLFVGAQCLVDAYRVQHASSKSSLLLRAPPRRFCPLRRPSTWLAKNLGG